MRIHQLMTMILFSLVTMQNIFASDHETPVLDHVKVARELNSGSFFLEDSWGRGFLSFQQSYRGTSKLTLIKNADETCRINIISEKDGRIRLKTTYGNYIAVSKDNLSVSLSLPENSNNQHDFFFRAFYMGSGTYIFMSTIYESGTGYFLAPGKKLESHYDYGTIQSIDEAPRFYLRKVDKPEDKEFLVIEAPWRDPELVTNGRLTSWDHAKSRLFSLSFLNSGIIYKNQTILMRKGLSEQAIQKCLKLGVSLEEVE